ncbi:hypothetical protein ACTJIV_10415 [Chryseobacterium sp. 22532]|uniref:hypothetical protein n=1 Tax=Chryseobacterium sp. 22532 TaxID=3453938 RepID=UPI003F86AD99
MLALLGLFTTGWASAQIETPELQELRQGKEYNISQKQTFPDFSYQSSNHADPNEIRS